MKITRIVCDVCGKDRGERNHWFFAYVNDGFHVEPIENAPSTMNYPEYEWHICGLDCLKEKLRTYVESFMPRHEPVTVPDPHENIPPDPYDDLPF